MEDPLALARRVAVAQGTIVRLPSEGGEGG